MQTRTHKHQRVAQKLRELIGELSPGDRLPSVAELEAHFNVASSTVEAAMRTLTDERLIERRRGSGTYVAWRKQASAPSLLATRPLTGMIGVVALCAPLVILSDLLESVERELRTADESPVLILGSSVDETRIFAACQKVRDGVLDGFVHLGSLDMPIPSEIPAVIMGETTNESDAWMVTVDNIQVGEKVASHLAGLGHKRMAFVGGYQLNIIWAPRLKGYRDWITSHGMEWRDEWVVKADTSGTFDYSDADVQKLTQALSVLMARDDRPTAVFGVTDQNAVLIIRVLERLGYRVPEDVSVVGCDDSRGLAGILARPLTTVKMPTESIGMVGVQMLRDRIALQRENALPASRRALRLAGSLVIRETTAPPSVQ
ncbi:MAG: GntR family transcriptional regulator [Capsulimonadaceae bacterium]|nr:GntR family transcriptional regulator [Capsulimonadaceae bacterium]